jgi:hypothetical protein
VTRDGRINPITRSQEKEAFQVNDRDRPEPSTADPADGGDGSY